MANGIERLVARALDAHLCGADGYGVARVAEQMGRPERTVRNWCQGVCSPSAVDLLLLVDAMQSEDPAKATLLWADLSRIVRHTAHPVDVSSDTDPIPVDVLQANAAGGALAGEIASHGEETDAHEARRALPLARVAVRETLAIVAKLEALAATGPQRALVLR